jgi:molybdopterin molybdotransferase
MTATAQLMPVAEAQARLLRLVAPRTTGEELVPLAIGLGRVLARSVTAGWPLPGCDNSAMDGYAVLAAGCVAATPVFPVRLPIRGDARAGAPIATLASGTAMAVATGGAIPRGADAVVPVEDTRVAEDGAVLVLQAPRPGAHVRRAGEDAGAGTEMVPAGRRLRAVDIAACASAGAASVWVHRRPAVALLSGGDELVPVGVPPEPHQVTDSNAAMLAAAVVEAGGRVVDLGRAHDSSEAVRERLRAAAGCDLVVSSSGVSVGQHDHIHEVVAELGRVEAWRLAMRPGKPLLIGEVGGIPMLGLPGNPASAAVTFELFARPALLTLQGASQPHRRRIAVRVGETVETPRALETYLRVRLSEAGDGIPVATLSGGQSSSMLRSLSGADGLMVVPAGVDRVEEGELLTALEMS